MSYIPIDPITELKLLPWWTMLTLAPHLCAITNLLSSSSIFPLRISFCIFARYFRQILTLTFPSQDFFFGRCILWPNSLHFLRRWKIFYYAFFCYLSLTLAKGDHEIPMKRNLCVFRDSHRQFVIMISKDQTLLKLGGIKSLT